jgi:hypothetical protein
MPTPRTLLASALTLLLGCALQAADSKPIARVLEVQDIETDDAARYAAQIVPLNDAIKAKLGDAATIHVYRSNFDGARTSSVRVVIAAESIAALSKNLATMDSDPKYAQARQSLSVSRKLGAKVLYQCVRFDGTNKVNSTYTTLAVVTDEAAYLKALESLRAMIDQAGFKDTKLNVYRVVAGRNNHTHRITFSSPAPDRLAALMDHLATDAKVQDWIAGSAKYRTVISNGTAQEITK